MFNSAEGSHLCWYFVQGMSLINRIDNKVVSFYQINQRFLAYGQVFKCHCNHTKQLMPSLSFDRVNKNKLIELQHQDPSLSHLWDLARNHEKKFFIVDGMLMCLTTTHNSVSNALVVPKDLRHKILVVTSLGPSC